MHVTLEPIILASQKKVAFNVWLGISGACYLFLCVFLPLFFSLLKCSLVREDSGRTTYQELKSVWVLKSVSLRLSNKVVFSGEKELTLADDIEIYKYHTKARIMSENNGVNRERNGIRNNQRPDHILINWF